MKVAVFDVCDTLYDSNTTFDFLDDYFDDNRKYQLFRKCSTSFLGKVLNYPLYRFFNYDIVRVIATGFLRGESQHELEIAVKTFVYEKLSDKVYNSVQELMNTYKDKGFTIFLMSGSYSPIVKYVCDFFEADDFVASELEIVDNKYTGKYVNDQLFNKKKVLLEKYANIDQLVVISDNKTDYDLFEIADKSYIVCNKLKDKIFWSHRISKFLDVNYMKMYSD